MGEEQVFLVKSHKGPFKLGGDAYHISLGGCNGLSKES